MLTALVLTQVIALQAPMMDALPHSVSEAQIEQLFDSTGDMLAKDAAATTQQRVVTVASDDRGALDIYYPFLLTKDLYPALEEELALMWVVTALAYPFIGPLWIPTAIGKVELADEYTTEALIGWLIHMVPYLFMVAGPFFWIGWGYAVINGLYLGPVHVLNLASHHATGTKKGGKKKGKKKSRSAHLDLPGMRSAAVGAY